MDTPRTIDAAQEALTKGEITAVELTKAAGDSIKAWQAGHAYLQTFEHEALTQAEASDQRRRQGKAGILEGIPIAVKDNICTKEGRTTAASAILENFTALYDATVVECLKAAGAIIVGKTNLDEFAMGSSTEYSAHGVTKNPWDQTRVAGGSSGGSAVAVATNTVFGALGTDTGGSIRQPASFCNVVGVKPTYGRVSRFGAIAYGSSLDQIGPFARTVKDAAQLLSVMAGPDRRDATTSPDKPPAYLPNLTPDLTGVVVGVPNEFFSEGLQSEVKELIQAALQQMAQAGAILKNISLPLTAAAIPVYYLLAKAEASSNLSRFDALRFAPLQLRQTALVERYQEARGQGFGPEVKRAILMGTYALSAGYYDAWYKQASKVRTLIRREYEEVFKEVQVIASPVSPEVAFPIGSKTDDPYAMYLADALTVPLSVAGLPAISIPAGFTKAGLPVGLQIAAPHFQEDRMFQVAYAYEQMNTWWQKSPQRA